MKLGDAFVALGFDVDDDKLKAFQDKIDQLEVSMFKVSGVSAAAVYGLDKFIDSVSGGAIHLINLHNLMQTSMQDLQQWSMAAHRSDLSFGVEQAQDSLEAMNSALAKFKVTGEGGTTYQRILNANPMGMNIFQVLERLHQNLPFAVQQFGTVQAVMDKAAEVGISKGWTNLLELGDKDFSAKLKEVKQYMLSDTEIKALADLGNATDQLGMKFTKLKATLAVTFEPQLLRALNSIPSIFQNIGRALEEIGSHPAAIKTLEILGGLMAVSSLALSPWILLAGIIGEIAFFLDSWGDALQGADNWVAKLWKEEDAFFTSMKKWIDDIGDDIQNKIWKPFKDTFNMPISDLFAGYSTSNIIPNLQSLFAQNPQSSGISNATNNVTVTNNIHANDVRQAGESAASLTDSILRQTHAAVGGSNQ